MNLKNLLHTLLLALMLVSHNVLAGLDNKAVANVDAGNTKVTGQTFTYVLSYSCSNTSGDCLNARIVDALPPEVVYVSHAATSDVASVNTPSVGSNGTVEFIMNTPLTAGNAGDVIVNVRFPLGSTPDGVVASNTADGVNLETTPGTFPSNTVNVTAVATVGTTLSKTLLTDPSNLDRETRYRLRVANDGELNISNLSFVDTLPLGDLNTNPPIFQGATPAANCEPGCIGTKLTAPYQLDWSGLSVNAGQNRDITVRVEYDSTDFSNGVNVTNEFTATGDPLNEPPNQNFGIGQANHDVVTFTPAPQLGFDKSRGGPVPPTYNQEFYYSLRPRNTGNVDLENIVVVDTLPVQFQLNSVRTGRYNSSLSDYAVGQGVRVEYEASTNPGVWVLLGSSPDVDTNSTFPAPVLGAGYVTRLRWLYGTAAPGMAEAGGSGGRARVYGEIINPDNASGAVNLGDNIENCADMDGEYPLSTALSTNNDCTDFDLSDDFIQFDPDKDDLTDSGPYVGGDTINWRLRARSHVYSSIGLPLEDLVLTDLLPIDLIYADNYVFSAGTSGIAAPDNFEQIENYKNTGRTLLRWTWNAGAGNLPRDTYADITYDTTVRNGVQLGNLSNTFGMLHDHPTFGQRCDETNGDDLLDLDDDADVVEKICTKTESVEVQPVAQLVSAKIVEGLCDSGFTNSSAGTLNGGAFPYKLSVQNTGTVTMDSFTLIDILPHVGDTGVIDTNPRGSEWNPLLVSPIVGPPGVSVYYSTSGNPCRGEVGGPTSSCDVPNWTTVPPSPITDTKSFKLDFGIKALISFDTLDFTFNMTAPADLPQSGETAFNSFAWRALRNDFATPLGAEPNKVGIAYGSCPSSSLGDYVWLDNDADGTQNDGNTGVNNVQMFLYGPGVDNIPGTVDDPKFATTITTDGPTGLPGWYLFPGLDAGDYYVCADVPPVYTVTAPDLGGNDVLDSDLNPATQCTGLVTLGSPEENLNLDVGLLLPVPPIAALGNYVWFDRNLDGVQNESPFDGVNGVTVNLFVDDGNGVADPGVDPQVAVTATANDANGIPGYYEFTGLTPGLPYFVQFILPPTATDFTLHNTGADDTVDSDADLSNGASQIVTLAAAEFNPTLDAGLILPTGNLSLGNQVWVESDNDGLFEPQNGELGVNGVSLSLYKDTSADGIPSIDEYFGATTTFTSNGLDGRYLFDGLDSGEYIVVVNLDNLTGSGALAGLQTCTGNDPAPDPDDDVNGDDNGTNIGANLANHPVLLSPLGEPINDGDDDDNSNLSVDFCFTNVVVTTPQYDYGDNPDSIFGVGTNDYQTVALDEGAHHELSPAAPYLGACVDADNGANENLLANADDNTSFGALFGTCAISGDDEDGVLFSQTSLLPGQSFTADVTATGSCNLNAWVDWNHNGDFTDVGEQVATDISVGSTQLNLTVPGGTLPGPVYARFRCSSAGGDSSTGLALDGEVEDYLLDIIGSDLGDLPDSYATLLASGGPIHQVDPGSALMLGSCVDTEADGADSADAEGDDTAVGSSTVGLCADDEDGVTFVNGNELFVCQVNNITVQANRAGILDAWIDFNANGVMDAADQVFASQPVIAGNNLLSVNVPCDAPPGDSYARFRISSAGGLAVGGAAADGEVEDYLVAFRGTDLGDAPDTSNGTAKQDYQTLSANNGATHILGVSNAPYLGACVDGDDGTAQNITADADDVTGSLMNIGSCVGDDEDGVQFNGLLKRGAAGSIEVTASSATGNCLLNAWVDYNQNGVFDSTEQIATDLAVISGNTVTLTPIVPPAALIGKTYARFRCSSAGGDTPTGLALDGEVEDYRVTVYPNLSLTPVDFGDAPDSYATTEASSGPSHVLGITGAPYLGNCVDSDLGLGENADANADDNTAAGGLNVVVGACDVTGDEDGVAFLDPLNKGTNPRIQITTGPDAACVLNGWIDFNQDGNFNGVNEQVMLDRVQAAGSVEEYQISVPNTAVFGSTYVRFRCSSEAGLSPDGPAPDGEVEDYVQSILNAVPVPMLSPFGLAFLSLILAMAGWRRRMK